MGSSLVGFRLCTSVSIDFTSSVFRIVRFRVVDISSTIGIRALVRKRGSEVDLVKGFLVGRSFGSKGS